MDSWREGRWRGSIAMGVVSSTFSTVFISLAGRRIGRDLPTNWMEIATTYFRSPAITKEPKVAAVLGGILVHQSADFGWAVAFYGLLGRWTRRLSPVKVLLLGPPWALATAFAEYYVILPRLQPLVNMQQPFWTPLAVHFVSGTAYPLFPLVRERVAGEPVPHTRFAKRWAALLGLGTAVMGALWLAGRSGREFRWPPGGVRADGPEGEFLRKMVGHHELGLRMAEMAADRSDLPELRKLSELMTAEHAGELKVMRNWWRSWFGDEVPGLTSEERRHMEGMTEPERVRELEKTDGGRFRRLFLPAMIHHHGGAISMSDRAVDEAADPRVRLLARAIRHAQRGQVRRMKEMM